MASIGFFGRLGNLWKGFLSLWISEEERKHPEIAYENAINSMVEKYSSLKQATAALIRRREELDGRFAAQARELTQVSADLDTAVATNQDDLALLLIKKKQALEAEVASLKRELEEAGKEAGAAKQSLLQVQEEIRRLREEKDRMIARLRSAEARLRIQEQLEGLSVEADVRALETVREHIKNRVAEASLSKELSETSLDARLSALRTQTGDVAARAELERLKAARAAEPVQKKTL
ncbi:MAG TPA: PspA/IM30 family protein [Anaeromyxobacter sp.]|nr:PspA/IM30 family protein [Anaeromyxobacter sp.]